MSTGWQIYFDITRYGHIASGITWIGLLYYFNFVQVPSFAKMEPAARSNAIMILVPRALLIFRYAALLTFLFGLAYLAAANKAEPGYWHHPRGHSISIGAAFGIVMAANVWFVIWPLQKKIIAATTATVKEGKPAPPDQPKWARAAALASRTNTMLSVPMLFFMVAAIHLQKLWS